MHEMSNHVFWRKKNKKNKKTIINVSSAELAKSVVKIITLC